MYVRLLYILIHFISIVIIITGARPKFQLYAVFFSAPPFLIYTSTARSATVYARARAHIYLFNLSKLFKVFSFFASFFLFLKVLIFSHLVLIIRHHFLIIRHHFLTISAPKSPILSNILHNG